MRRRLSHMSKKKTIGACIAIQAILIGVGLWIATRPQASGKTITLYVTGPLSSEVKEWISESLRLNGMKVVATPNHPTIRVETAALIRGPIAQWNVKVVVNGNERGFTEVYPALTKPPKDLEDLEVPRGLLERIFREIYELLEAGPRSRAAPAFFVLNILIRVITLSFALLVLSLSKY